MIKTKFFEVIKTFSDEDYVKFGQFIESDYFNKSLMLRKLYGVILKSNPEPSKENLTFESFFNELYPDKKYREATIVNLFSGLYKLAEDYIAIEVYKNESFDREKYLLRGFGRRNLDKFVLKIYSQSLEKVKNSPTKNLYYFQKIHDIEYEYILYLSENDNTYELSTELIQHYQNKLLEYFILKLLSNYAFMLNQKSYVRDHDFNLDFLEHLLDYLKENPSANLPTISAYFNLVMLIKEDDEKYFFKLKELEQDFAKISDGIEKRNFYTVMINFCLIKARVSGVNKFTREAFELLRTNIEKNIYKTNVTPNIDHLLYLNVVMTGLNVKEFDWVENFIIKYKSELIEEHKESTYNLCYALFHFNKKNYEKSLEYLKKVLRKNTFFNIQINSLILQNYYEMNLFENAFSFIDSYKHYLKENTEIASINTTRAKNFLDTVYNLLKIKCGTYNYDPSIFDLSREEYINISKKDWIVEKIEEIKKD